MKKIIALLSALFLCQIFAFGQIKKERVLDEINGWRSDVCFCGNVKKRPAGELIWDNKLEEVAQEYADELSAENEKNKPSARRVRIDSNKQSVPASRNALFSIDCLYLANQGNVQDKTTD